MEQAEQQLRSVIEAEEASEFTPVVVAATRHRDFHSHPSSDRHDKERAKHALLQICEVVRDSFSNDRAAVLNVSLDRITVIGDASDIVSVLQADGTSCYQSRSIERILGYTPGERVGRKPLEFVHPEDFEKWCSTLNSTIGNPDIEHRVEYRYRHKNGSWRMLESWGKAVVVEGVVAVVAYTRDITALTTSEELSSRQNALSG